jgi:5-methylcytosine-specific restriction protein B
MSQIFVFTAGNDAARQHLEDSIISPIKEEIIEQHAPAELKEKLAEYKISEGGVYAWGAEPGERNKPNWELMQPDDAVLCVYDSIYHFTAKVLSTVESEELARAIWGINPKTHNTWQYMYFLTKPRKVNVRLEQVVEWLSAGYRGFARIGDDKVNTIITQFGSVENFIEQKFVSPTPPKDPVQEFLEIMRRYQKENVVFQSAAQGARYAIESVDEGGCDIQRLDEKQNARCATGKVRAKIELVQSKGGRMPYDEEFEHTVAIKTAVLQAEVFALSPDQKDILLVEDEAKALDAFCHVLEELRVSKSSGEPKLYKPAMIACVIEGVASGELEENKIHFEWVAPKFIAKLASLGKDVGEHEAAMPFVHLTGDQLWLLAYKDLNELMRDGKEGPAAIRKKVAHAKLKDTFWHLLQSEKNREQLLNVLGDRWWAEKSSSDLPQCWWVSQGQTYEEEKAGGYIWAPKKNKGGKENYYHTNVSKVKSGAIIFSYSNKAIRAVSIATTDGRSEERPGELGGGQWEKDGWGATLEYFALSEPISIEEVGGRIAHLGYKYSPVDKNGDGQQGYLFELKPDAVRILLAHIDLETLPKAISEQLRKFLNKVSGGPKMDPLLEEIYKRIQARGMVFSREEVENFYCCLRTKPFVLLAGISGTGKSRLVRLFAEAVGATTENHRFKLIPVRPDWNDNSDLIGYFNLEGKFQPGALVPTLVRAHANPKEPYFLCLDEMNLARVEHYFSDFLSVIESRRWVEVEGSKQVQTDPILTKEQLTSLQEAASLEADVKAALPALVATNGGGLSFPDNLYVVGTVNMDETTHPFSRKVLDRASAIEFSNIRLMEGIEAPPKEKMEPAGLTNEQLRGEFITMPDLAAADPKMAKATAERLMKINAILRRGGFEIGYRVRDEATFYLHYADTVGIENGRGWERVVLQKILPRLQGSSELVKQVLVGLLGQFEVKLDPEEEGYRQKLAELAEGTSLIQRKLAQMLVRYEMDGFTSYWAG